MNKAIFTYSFYKSYKFRWLPYFIKGRLMWKDKFGSPRCEKEPHFEIEWLWFGVYGIWGSDQYWEQWLWLNKYCEGDMSKAKATWGWIDSDTKKSTWEDYD